MPGIAGIISKVRRERNESDLQSMLSCMKRESFYASGTYMQHDMGLYACWVCHKDSFCDCMPVMNEKKDLALIFFGEHFADLDFFDGLKAKHHTFDSSNASCLIHMYEESGMNFLNDLNGWFSGILIDLQKNIAVLFNDRYGMQKIFYHESGDAFYFASEAKALLGICPELRELDMPGLAELLTCSSVLENRTLFRNIFLLPCASVWIFNKEGHINKSQYFTPDAWENQPCLEKDFFYDKLRETFRRILPRYFRGSQKIGISLTGGVDTRMIMAHMDLPTEKYPCYTFGGMYRDSFDVSISQKVAAAKGQTHETILVDKNFLNNFSSWAEKAVYLTDGYLDVSGSCEIYVNTLARKIAPIRLTGNLGGEILRSMRHLKANPPLQSIFQNDLYVYTQDVKNTLDKYTREPLSFVLFNDSPWLNNNRLVGEQTQLTMRTPYMDNDLVALVYRLKTDIRRNKEISLRLIADGSPALADIFTDKGLGGNAISPISAIIHLLYEALAKAEYAYDYGMPQWLAKFDSIFKFMHFERLFLGRHKFYHFRLWYRDELAGYVKSILLDDRTLTRPYLNRKFVEHIVESHTKGYRNYTTDITRLLTIELIQRQLIEQD